MHLMSIISNHSLNYNTTTMAPTTAEGSAKHLICVPIATIFTSISAEIQLLHHNNGPESCLATHHMLKRFGCFMKREFLDHAVDVMDFGELDGFFAVYGELASDAQ